MKKQIIISISREYGTGGHEVAEKIANQLDVKIYDRNLLDHLAGEKDIKAEDWESYDEKAGNPLITRHVRGFSNSMEEHLAQMQFDFIRAKAMSGESFVIVGRCAESVLRGNDNLVSFFILGDDDDKMRRVAKKYNISESDAIAKIRRHDISRKKYHNKYSKYKWGDSRAYDLTLNVSRMGIEKTTAIMLEYLNLRTNC